ncbi:ketosamine-3-kinase [Folsomia candida]|uniref:protein-ribulosamine 3-kinase n=1 Tax=Folsomia candida TaxID=158441 RepID=A0A226DDP5_FOLCA|nr:ketosamine-3-kinase [Folsomia candida]OXA43682.1 Ketosamine-3-kinase [Folsomia candida]
MDAAVKKALDTKTFRPTGRGGGGSISSGSSYITDDGTVFVKINEKSNALTMFEGERAGLEAILATETIRCPKPIAIVKDGSNVALVMENLNMTSMTSHQQEILGEQLARMHLHNKMIVDEMHKGESRITTGSGDEDSSIKVVRKFGFSVPTCCGYISQDNTWQEDWTVFYLRQKLQAQVDRILRKAGDRDLNDVWSLCCQKIETQLSKLANIVPALVHGDLWSGNVASSESVPVIYDPASFYGHSEFDFGIARMFGGFSPSFYNAYFKINPKTDGFSERQDIYELFHHLNHWNHFGIGYKGSTISLLKKISTS